MILVPHQMDTLANISAFRPQWSVTVAPLIAVLIKFVDAFTAVFTAASACVAAFCKQTTLQGRPCTIRQWYHHDVVQLFLDVLYLILDLIDNIRDVIHCVKQAPAPHKHRLRD